MSEVLSINQKTINDKPRFIIVNEKGKIVNDANGYGFKSRYSASKSINYNKNPIRKVILDLIKRDKPFIEEQHDILINEFIYNLKDYGGLKEEHEEADNDAIKLFMKSLSEHFHINIFNEMRKTNTSYQRFLGHLEKLI